MHHLMSYVGGVEHSAEYEEQPIGKVRGYFEIGVIVVVIIAAGWLISTMHLFGWVVFLTTYMFAVGMSARKMLYGPMSVGQSLWVSLICCLFMAVPSTILPHEVLKDPLVATLINLVVGLLVWALVSIGPPFQYYLDSPLVGSLWLFGFRFLEGIFTNNIGLQHDMYILPSGTNPQQLPGQPILNAFGAVLVAACLVYGFKKIVEGSPSYSKEKFSWVERLRWPNAVAMVVVGGFISLVNSAIGNVWLYVPIVVVQLFAVSLTLHIVPPARGKDRLGWRASGVIGGIFTILTVGLLLLA